MPSKKKPDNPVKDSVAAASGFKGSGTLRGKSPLTEKEVMDFLQRIVQTYETGEQDFFECFAKDASLFTISTPTRIDGRETYEHNFAPFFLNNKRRSIILSPEVRLLGPDAAMVDFHNRILVGGISTNIRSTIVAARDQKGELKCVHMHNSPLTEAVAPPLAPTNLENLTVLEERVASASAMTGTPK